MRLVFMQYTVKRMSAMIITSTTATTMMISVKSTLEEDLDDSPGETVVLVAAVVADVAGSVERVVRTVFGTQTLEKQKPAVESSVTQSSLFALPRHGEGSMPTQTPLWRREKGIEKKEKKRLEDGARAIR